MPAALTGSGGSGVLPGPVLFAAGRAFIGWIPMDLPGAPPTATGRIHWLLGILSFGSAIYAAGALATVLRHQQQWHSLAGVSSTLATIVLIGVARLLISRFVPPPGKVFGLFERVLYAGAISWAGRLRRRPREQWTVARNHGPFGLSS